MMRVQTVLFTPLGQIVPAMQPAAILHLTDRTRAELLTADVKFVITQWQSLSCQQCIHRSACVFMQDAAVREAAVDALATLYEEEANVLPLHEFTTRFRSRMGELIYDIDDNVAVKGVRLDALPIH